MVTAKPKPDAVIDEFDLDFRLSHVEIQDKPQAEVFASGSCSCSCGQTCTCISQCSCATCNTCTCTDCDDGGFCLFSAFF